MLCWRQLCFGANPSSPTWRTFFYSKLLPDNRGCLSANSQLSSGCQLDHTLGVMAGLGVLAGTLACFRSKQLSIFSSDPTVIWDARWICGCDVPSPPFEMSAVSFGSLPLMSQLAAMAHLQVITKPGIRLHKNLHVCNCVSLPQKKPQQKQRWPLEQVWQCTGNSQFQGDRQPHTLGSTFCFVPRRAESEVSPRSAHQVWEHWRCPVLQILGSCFPL